MTVTKLSAEALRPKIDPGIVPFATTAEAPAGGARPAQDRAEGAIAFWVTVEGPGYNLYAAGPEGLERRAAIRRMIAAHSGPGTPQDDWVYVFNFENQYRPRALRLPFGTALPFRDAMADLVEDLATAIPAAFEAEEYKSRRSAIQAEAQSQQEEKIGAIRAEAAEQGIALVRTPVGFGFAPVRNGEIVKPEVFNRWPEEDRKEAEATVKALQEKLNAILQDDLPALEREVRAEIRELDRETAEATIKLAVEAVAEQFRDIAPIQAHLGDVSHDLITHFHLFIALDKAGEDVPLAAKLEHPMLRRYAVNVMDAGLSDETNGAGVPVIEETEPSHARLIGRIEHQPHEGALITDFTLIKPGALHRANGGFLILDARDLLMQPFAWESLKRCLKTGSIRIGSVAERFSMISTISLEPDEIPLQVKVALVGEARLYYLLAALDPDFPSLFKVHADFDTAMVRSDDNLTALADAAAARVRDLGLTPFDRSAVLAVLAELSRAADDAAKLSLRTEAMEDLLREADHVAARTGAGEVTEAHVAEVVAERRHRADRLHRLSLEAIEREIVTVATDGAEVGQINGLAVVTLGQHRFGRPARITAQARMGTGKIIDIEREVKLGGPIHSKGVLILSSFLATRFGQDHPVAFSASIVFEQSYGEVDGDSASSTELYALLSALADVPIRQALAVTGSVDQFGRVQAIGGVNEKIEGFFDLCAARGPVDGQGVLIPRSNMQHLNLRADVVDAVEDGRFAVYGVGHVDDGIELLTGVPAGRPDADGTYPPDSVNGRVAKRLDAYAEAMRKLRAGPGAAEDDDDIAGEDA